MNTLNLTSLLRGIDLAQIATKDGVELYGNQAGELYGPCPRCGGRDRFHVKIYDGKGWFFCRQCHEQRGDVIDYYMWLHGMTKRAAIEQVKALAGGVVLGTPGMATIALASTPATELPPAAEWQAAAREVIAQAQAYLWSDTPKAKAALTWLHERGLTDDTLRVFQVGYNPRGGEIGGVFVAEGFTLPTIVLGDVWQIRIRKPPKHVTPGGNKYTGIKGNKAGLFNGDTLKGARVVIVCGGEFDAMIGQQYAPHGVACVTFGSETKNPSLRWLMTMARVDRVLVAYDNDQAGASGKAKWNKALGDRAEAMEVPSPAHDVTDYWQRGGDVGALLASWVSGDQMPQASSVKLIVDTPALQMWTGPQAELDKLVNPSGDDDDDNELLEKVFAWGETRNYEAVLGADGRYQMVRKTQKGGSE